MISGALPEPTIQLTVTSLRLRTANSVIRIVSTTATPMRAISFALRRVSSSRPAAAGGGVLVGSLDIVDMIVPPSAGGVRRRGATMHPIAAAGEALNTMGAMRTALSARSFVPAACLLALALSACGGGSTKTVTAASAPQTTPGAPTQSSSSPAKTTTPSAPATTTGSSGTRTAPGPAFAEEHQSAPAEGAGAAAAIVRAKGYTPNNTAEYHSTQTLRVLTGTRTGSSDGYGQQAFFFLDGRYLGTDTKEPSAQLKVVSQSDTEVAVAYPLYRHGDSLCCPGGGTRVVHFALNNGKLTALDPIPPANSATGLSRN